MSSDFEDRLLTELKREVVRAAADEPRRAPGRGRFVTPGRAVAGLATATAAAAAVLVLPGGGAGPAYAVEPDGAGGVEVRLTDWPRGEAEIDAFLAELADAGVASVYNPPAGYHCQPFPDGLFVGVSRMEVGEYLPELEEHARDNPLGGARLLHPVAQDPPAPTVVTGDENGISYVRAGDNEFPEDVTYRLEEGDTVLLVDQPTFGSIAFVDGACADVPTE
ncbi:hypothetical protein RM844_01720 [Streptomyces sp. DSM 44915]|uniref:Uncharacterized protein n=1 Tax=Streptomyces chisholmiae TaxID=3075540 RepID=A0ABU2JJ37_9ACTN|nr:hypothetical protein [Streptomyces sp. DSM 44915]MDT0265000.1 hypothetical protein [Streptomyces sp. DSM 44915]